MTNKLSEEQARKIYDEHADFIQRTVFLMVRSSSVADDITQETFIKAFRSYSNFDQTKPIRPWLYTIALNVTRNYLRSRNWLTFTPELPELPSKSTEITIMEREQNRMIRAEIDNLPSKIRDVVILHFLGELTLVEVSETLGIPLGTCKSRLNSALRMLRKSLGREDFLFQMNGGG